jgi:hypothetical protein
MLTVYASDALYRPQTGLQELEPDSPNRKRSHTLFLESSFDRIPSPKRNCSGPIAQWLESIPSDSWEEESPWPNATLEDPAIDMEYTQDADGYVIPPTPGRSRAPSNISVSSASSSRKRLIEDPDYRAINLRANNIFLRSPTAPIPEYVTLLLDDMRKAHGSPSPSLDQVRQDSDLQALEDCKSEDKVEEYFKATIFPRPHETDLLARISRLPMSKKAVPEVEPRSKLSTPQPDLLFGYNRDILLQHTSQLLEMGTDFVANSLNVVFPFLIIEFKADGPTETGSLWAATNQCLTATASCINIGERLNDRAARYNCGRFDTTVFSIAMNGTEARLFVSWKQDNDSYYTQKVDSFALQRAEHYLEFRNYVLNIIDWGLKTRLERIQNLLDQLFEEDRKALSHMAKSRQPPSDDTSNEGSKKRRDSSSSARRGRPRHVQDPGLAE